MLPRLFQTRSFENQSVNISDPGALGVLFGDNGRSFAGEAVNEETALGVPALWSAVNFIAGTIAGLSLDVYKKTDTGRQKLDNDPLQRIVHDVVNDSGETSYQWRHYTLCRTLLGGRSFTFIERNGAGRVSNLWKLDPSRVTVQMTKGRLQYLYTPFSGPSATYQDTEVIDVPWHLKSDGFTHRNPLYTLRNTIGLAIASERYASTTFENGGVPPLALTGPTMSGASASRASTDIQDALQRARRDKRNVLVVPEPYKLDQIGFDATKTQMLESRKFDVIQIARIFGLPPVFLQDLSTGTYSNTEQQDLNFIKHTLTQWLERFEQEFNSKLFGIRNKTNYVEFNVNGLLRGDFETRMTGFSTAINAGVLTPNEARQMENRPDKPGGDELIVNSASVLLTNLGNDTDGGTANDPEDPDALDPGEPVLPKAA